MSRDHRPARRPFPATSSARSWRAAACGAIIALALATAGATTDARAAAQAAEPQPRYYSLTASDGVVAVLQASGNEGMQLLVGTSATDLQPAPVDEIPGTRLLVPALHAGTDAAGKPVVVYPRCVGGPPVACDLSSYHVSTKTERRIKGIRRAGRSEVEGVMRGGALLYSAPAGPKAGTGIWYRPAGSARERRISSWGGWDLALRGKRIAYVLSDGSKTAGEEPCDNTTIALRSTGGGPAKAIARTCELTYGSPGPQSPYTNWLSPTFHGDWLYFATMGGAPQLFRYQLGTGRAEQARVTGSVFAYRPTGSTSGIAQLIPTGDPAFGADWPVANQVTALSGLVWKPRKTPLVQSVLYVRPEALR